MPDFDRARKFLTQIAAAEVTRERRPHQVCYARRHVFAISSMD
jgi:hypothetical protein